MKLLGTLLILMSLTLIFCQSSRETPADKLAIESAIQWLALVDSGKYRQSWEETAEIFRRAVTSDGWEQKMSIHREPLGKLISREVKSAKYRTTLPGAPDAEYVVITFEASYENKKSAIETVTPMKEKDGTWRVSGYYLR